MGVRNYLEEHGLSSDLLTLGLSLDRDDIVFVTGWFADGRGDADSDLVVHLLTDERGFDRRAPRFVPNPRLSQPEHGQCGILYERVGSVDLEVRVHLRRTVDALLDALDGTSPSECEEILGAFSAMGAFDHESAVDLLDRLRSGRPVVNVAAFERLQRRLCPRKLAAWKVHHALLRGGDAMAGAVSSLQQNDVENAYLRLTDLYDALGDAVLSARGRSIDRGNKGRVPRLMALGSSPFADLYLDVTLPRRPPWEPLGAFVERQLEAAGDVVERLRRETRVPPPPVSQRADAA